jgi:tRNA threonylcarbamoyladenosine modification (KEOPS) complex  Pcc1 subunit
MYKLEVSIEKSDLAIQVFKILEQEVRFGRGRICVEDEKIVAEAADVSSLRSLLHTIFRALYLVEHVSQL